MARSLHLCRKEFLLNHHLLLILILCVLLCWERAIRNRQSHLSAPSEAPSDEMLEWPMKDNRRFLRVVYHVGDLDRTIKFYTEGIGMKLLREKDFPERKYSNALLGFGQEETNFVVELVYNYEVDKYDTGTGFGHLGISTTDIYKVVENIRAQGGVFTWEPGPAEGGGKAIVAFVKDPNGYEIELLQRRPTPQPLSQVMLRVSDLDRSINFYEKALGMKLLHKFDRPELNYTLGMVGYGDDQYETSVLELIYNYGVIQCTKRNAYAQVAIGTDDAYKSALVVNLVSQELGGKTTQSPGPSSPRTKTKIASFLDPDGWKIVLMDNKDFLKELEE